jgi:outer membrane protein OmpA-like peptidoglycan-associated protein
MQPGPMRQCAILGLVLVGGLGLSTGAFADDHIKGVIQGRGANGALMVLTDDSSNVMVVMRDYTKVRRVTATGDKKMSSSELVPGLRVRVKGEYEAANRLVATHVKFYKSDQKMAQAIQGGVAPTDQRSLANQQRIEQNEKTIAQQQETLQRQAQQIASNKGQIDINAQKIVATTGALEATNARIGNLDDYNVISTITVYFQNGRASIAPSYKAQLQEFAGRAKGVRGYVVQVKGFASAVGADALNQRLSKQRADAVTAVLQQHGIPPTNIVVPAAMGVSDQVAANKTAKGQAKNRRTVVTLLQNKGIAER